MTDISQSAPWREQKSLVFLRQKLTAFLRGLHPRARLHGDLSTPHITDHIAKDIGLSDTDLEQMRRRWPSEQNRW